LTVTERAPMRPPAIRAAAGVATKAAETIMTAIHAAPKALTLLMGGFVVLFPRSLSGRTSGVSAPGAGVMRPRT
jgi:hypothetical protein